MWRQSLHLLIFIAYLITVSVVHLYTMMQSGSLLYWLLFSANPMYAQKFVKKGKYIEHICMGRLTIVVSNANPTLMGFIQKGII